MNIHFLLVKDFFKGGGVETYTRDVSRRLVERGHEVTVYSTSADDDLPSSWNGVRIVWLPKLRPSWAEKLFGAFLATYRELRSGSADVVHLHSVAAGAMACVLRYRRAPCIVQMHGLEWKRSRWGFFARAVLRLLEHASVRAGAAITAVSKTQCDYYASHYRSLCRYIPTAVEPKVFAPPRALLSLGLTPRKYVLFAARLVPEKGAQYLIPAFRRLNTDCSLVIAGDALEPSFRRHLVEMAAGDPRIVFLGDVRGPLLEELFSNARIFAQPSEVEGLSIGLIEAMSYGLQCVASDIPENLEVIGEAGESFRSKDPDDLCRVLDRSLRDDEAARAIGARARRRVSELFTWDVVVDQLEELYGCVSQRKGRRRITLATFPSKATMLMSGMAEEAITSNIRVGGSQQTTEKVGR
jgi:glycosyltransferase involved in cell wall biosynthesis